MEAALGFLERHAALTRRWFGGVESLTTSGFVAARFRHRLSRNGDPQVRSHVLVANVVLGADGRWGTLDARHLYAQRLAAGYLYQVQLRHELTRTLGVAWTPLHRGAGEVLGVPPSLLRALSSRRAEIEEHLAVAGTSGRRRRSALRWRPAGPNRTWTSTSCRPAGTRWPSSTASARNSSAGSSASVHRST